MANPIFIIFLIGFSLGIAALAKNESKSIYDEVFAPRNLFSVRKRATTDRTYTNLIKLSSLYKGKRDEVSLRRSAEVEALVETRKATLNIIPYLTDNIQRLFSFCKDALYHNLEEGLSNFSDLEKEDMDKIRLYIMHGRYKIREPLYYISSEALEDGLLEFLKDRAGGLVDFDTVIGGLCSKVLHELFEPLSILGLVYDGGKRPFLNEKAASWLINMEICKNVSQSSPELGRRVEARLEAKG